MYHEVIDSLKSVLPVPECVLAGFLKYTKIIRVPKGKLLLSEGDCCDKLWFLGSGLVRGFHAIDDGHGGLLDFTEWFAAPNEFFISAESFLRQTPARECIETLEASEVIYISRTDLYSLYEHYPETNSIGRMIAEHFCLSHMQQLRELRTLSAPERLEAFRTRSGDLFRRVPQKYIASYLGISENYVSKLKARR
ncbi:cyclic nucleotide-binding protein [Dyadobacter beijingensis]|uniref:Cyclic nucleotide-binding protein n=1 Tax=Dyadobacter beijingensis TaxID=365489 RepID=A0ABQ2I7D0_9BACT|nr:Crp/Fnr family transcriptional regulator [Dyadobacter beijingensis]GGN00111.1 cyclic nucleotide-binding protein [Dyadobacter beijingensis]